VLIHPCLSNYYVAYHALADLYQKGKIRAIGISNFSSEHIIENFNIFDCSLTGEEMEELRTLDDKKSLWLAYNNPRTVEMAMQEQQKRTAGFPLSFFFYFKNFSCFERRTYAPSLSKD